MLGDASVQDLGAELAANLKPGSIAVSTASWVHTQHQYDAGLDDLSSDEDEICEILSEVPELRDATTKERFAVRKPLPSPAFLAPAFLIADVPAPAHPTHLHTRAARRHPSESSCGSARAQDGSVVTKRYVGASTEPIYPRVKLPVRKEELAAKNVPKPLPNRGVATRLEATLPPPSLDEVRGDEERGAVEKPTGADGATSRALSEILDGVGDEEFNHSVGARVNAASNGSLAIRPSASSPIGGGASPHRGIASPHRALAVASPSQAAKELAGGSQFSLFGMRGPLFGGCASSDQVRGMSSSGRCSKSPGAATPAGLALVADGGGDALGEEISRLRLSSPPELISEPLAARRQLPPQQRIIDGRATDMGNQPPVREEPPQGQGHHRRTNSDPQSMIAQSGASLWPSTSQNGGVWGNDASAGLRSSASVWPAPAKTNDGMMPPPPPIVHTQAPTRSWQDGFQVVSRPPSSPTPGSYYGSATSSRPDTGAHSCSTCYYSCSSRPGTRDGVSRPGSCDGPMSRPGTMDGPMSRAGTMDGPMSRPGTMDGPISRPGTLDGRLHSPQQMSPNGHMAHASRPGSDFEALSPSPVRLSPMGHRGSRALPDSAASNALSVIDARQWMASSPTQGNYGGNLHQAQGHTQHHQMMLPTSLAQQSAQMGLGASANLNSQLRASAPSYQQHPPPQQQQQGIYPPASFGMPAQPTPLASMPNPTTSMGLSMGLWTSGSAGSQWTGTSMGPDLPPPQAQIQMQQQLQQQQLQQQQLQHHQQMQQQQQMHQQQMQAQAQVHQQQMQAQVQVQVQAHQLQHSHQQRQPLHMQQPQQQQQQQQTSANVRPGNGRTSVLDGSGAPPNRADGALSAPGVASADGSARLSREVTMSPKTRTVYKSFSHKLRSKETIGKGMAHAVELARSCMAELPSSVHWRVHLELADLAKREKQFKGARRLYRKATEMQPSAAQTWLEFAKMEEERGHFKRCQQILTAGLHHCPYNEALMLKAIKHMERMGELDQARGLLGKLVHVPISQSWRTLLEGALLEARAAQTVTARRIFKFLLQQAPWYGPVWHEACRFEQRCNHLQEALRIAELGLAQLPRYGPLWFCALRLYESTAQPNDLVRSTRALVDRGVKHISKDLIWKLWFECAQVEERNGHLMRARTAYVRSVANCAANLRWKVWLGGARTELCHSQFETAQVLLDRAFTESPPKTRAIVMLEQSRLHELRGNADEARQLLKGARKTSRQEWKVFLESILLELRSQALGRALREARKALDVHRGTGRLWAVLLQLEHSHGVERQLAVFQQALLEVPKSGEVWCEGARICLNPYSECFNLDAARNFLDFAIEFTPQYGDSFIEYLRLQMLVDADEAQIERLWQLCINAEPNYGTLWFHCKSSPLLSTRQVLSSATALIKAELLEWKHVYGAAIQRAESPEFRATTAEAVASALQSSDGLPMLSLPALEVEGEPKSSAADFVTGSVKLNRMQRRCADLSINERRRLIYGGDMIVP